MLGAGTQSSPYIIQTPQDLHNVRNNLTAYYELGNDIDMGSWGNFVPIGKDTKTFFKGTFDGKGHKIKNLTISESTGYVGLFGYINNATTIIKNVGIENCNISGGNVANWIGGIVGQLSNGTIENCFVTGTVQGKYMIGGIVGQFLNGTIKNCYSHASITGFGRVGGLVGYIGSSTAKVKNSYSTGRVIHTETGTAYPAGGLVGDNTSTTNVFNSYWDINTSGQTISEGGTGLTTAQMKQQSSFENWDFLNTWGINGDYPYLQVFGVPTKKQTVNLQSYVNPLYSKLSKTNKSTKQTQSFLNNIQTQIQRHTRTKKTISTYILQIETSVQKSNRTVRSVTQQVTSYMNPIGSIVERKTKTIKQLLSYVDNIQSNVNVIAPIRNKTVNAYITVLENPSIVQFEENFSNTYTFENHSTVQFEDNLSDIYAIENPSNVEF
ncbi:GLUG motif-containing protein [Geobacillus vulcani]|uniref:GLUG motif-containing protein n=1 Tax=Geobacillus vulcani TaxID=135517 RepID=UPI00090060BF|nr:GLUG motif-containing protein [Geobacillus vulcani]